MKGLESLIPQKKDPGKDDKISPNESVFMIEVEKIAPNPFQPRKEFNEAEMKDLTASVVQVGILQPLIVSKIEKDTPTGRDVSYELIAGERRLRAAKMANLPRVPVVVRRSTSPEKLAISVIENIQRQDLSPMEEASAYDRLAKQFGMSYPEIAEQVGKNKSVIANSVRMLKLPQDMIGAINAGNLNMGHSRFLLALNNYPEKQKKLFEEIIRRNLDAASAQKRLWELQAEDGSSPQKRVVTARNDNELNLLADKVKDSIGINGVKLSRTGRHTRLLIEFPTKGQMVEWINKKILSS